MTSAQTSLKRFKHVPTRSVVGASGVGEAEDDVVGGALVEVRQELLDAELEHHGQPGVVGLQQDADAVNLLVVRDVGEDVLEVLPILLDAPGERPIRAPVSVMPYAPSWTLVQYLVSPMPGVSISLTLVDPL